MACFKPLKSTFKRERDTSMVRRNCIELDKISLVGWVDKALDQTFTRKNIISRFKATRIWPFNPRTMDHKTSLSTLYNVLLFVQRVCKGMLGSLLKIMMPMDVPSSNHDFLNEVYSMKVQLFHS